MKTTLLLTSCLFFTLQVYGQRKVVTAGGLNGGSSYNRSKSTSTPTRYYDAPSRSYDRSVDYETPPVYTGPPPKPDRVEHKPKDIVNDFWGAKDMSAPGTNPAAKNFWGESSNTTNSYNTTEPNSRNPSVSDRVENSYTPGNDRYQMNNTSSPRSVGASDYNSNTVENNSRANFNSTNSSSRPSQSGVGEQRSAPRQGISNQTQRPNNF